MQLNCIEHTSILVNIIFPITFTLECSAEVGLAAC